MLQPKAKSAEQESEAVLTALAEKFLLKEGRLTLRAVRIGTANASSGGQGIGGGSFRNGGDITFSGGQVVARPGIGNRFQSGNAGTLTIEKGYKKFTGDVYVDANKITCKEHLYKNNKCIWCETAFDGKIGEDSFPDENFRKYVISKFDKNKDGYLSSEEIKQVKEIRIDYSIRKNISSLKAIEHFTFLQVLDCQETQIKELDVSACTMLKELYCGKTPLSKLNISGCTALMRLFCENTLLKQLDVGGCTALKELSCFANTQLMELNLSGCTSLKKLDCVCNELVKLDVSDCVALEWLNCSNNQLVDLNVSNCSLLQRLECDNNQLTELNVNDCTSICVLWCSNNKLASLILGDKLELTDLYCPNNKLKYIDISGCSHLNPYNCGYVSFTTHALVLSGQIGVYFYTDLPEITGLDYSNAYMTFDINGDTTSNNPQMFDAMLMNAKGDYYGFVCYVNSVQIADTITATLHLHYGDDWATQHCYSVKEYLDTIIERTASESMRNLAKAMKDYGHYMQVYLARKNGWDIGIKHAAMDCANTYTDDDIEEIRQRVSDYSIVRDTGNSGIEKVTFALELDSETIIDVYLKPKDGYAGAVEAYLDDSKENIATLQSDGRYLVQISGVSAHLLGNTYTIHVNAGEEFDVKVSALSYVSSILNAANSAKDIKEAVASLYDYYDATMAYRQSIGQ